GVGTPRGVTPARTGLAARAATGARPAARRGAIPARGDAHGASPETAARRALARDDGASRDLLFEIGVEELPATYVPGALEPLERGARAMLEGLRLSCGEIRALGAPRRLALQVQGLAARQTDLSEEALGPAV